jgi:precorrin-6Y C5,15-methyltransferase (decarboxylating)
MRGIRIRDMPVANEPLIETVAPDSAASPRWLSIVGIGEDGLDGLTPVARELIGSAEIVFGGRRHLALAAPLLRGPPRPWPNPFDGAAEEVSSHRGRQVCVLASGDPFNYGVGAVLARRIDPREMLVVPAPSAFSLAAARLGWSLPDTVLLSLHGRSLDLIRPHLQPGARLLVLTSDGESPGSLAQLLAQSGFGSSKLTMLEALGGPRERIRSTSAAEFAFGIVDALNTVAIEVEATPGARILPLTPGAPDDLFEHDGQISKREVRALVLSSLAPRRGELLWDIGSGSGSVAIEWMLTDPSMRAIAVERRADRAARIVRNAAACGVPDLRVVTGEAPAALGELPTPEAIFVGGGASDTSVLDAAARALRLGGRLVVNAVTLETEALILGRHSVLGGELLRLGISRAERLGGKTAWRPALPVMQWVWTKP